MRGPIPAVLLMVLLSAAACQAENTAAYKYSRVGAAQDRATATRAGFALMGGGNDLDEAFRWMCERADGGDFLILRAAGGDGYNRYIQKLCRVNSVATLILPSRAAANDPFVAQTIAHAEAIFIAGGDQANYIRFWTGTPVQAGINAAIRRGVPIGGTSAGLAVMGEWVYSAEGDKPDDPNLDSKTALADPLSPRITLVHGFLDIPVLKGIITDSHFDKRDRMGRLLVFLTSLNVRGGKQNAGGRQIRGLGVDQETAVLIRPNGAAEVVGKGSAYWIEPATSLAAPEANRPLTSGPFLVQKIEHGMRFDRYHARQFGDYYQLAVEAGTIKPLQSGRSIY